MICIDNVNDDSNCDAAVYLVWTIVVFVCVCIVVYDYNNTNKKKLNF